MPLYEFRCRRCGLATTRLGAISDAPRQVPCDACGAEARRIISSPAVHLAPGSKVARLDPRYDQLVDRAMRRTPQADPERLINRRGDIAKGGPDGG